MPTLRRIFTYFTQDSLIRNANYLILSSFVMAGIGFFFWSLCARLFTTEQIGLATTLISVTSLITGFSMFGFNTALVRFLPNAKDKNAFINTAMGIVAVGSIFISVIFLLGLPVFSPKLAFIQRYPLFELSFVLFMMIASLNTLTDSVFLSYRRTEFTLIINTVMSLTKLALPILLVSLGAYGIFYAFMASIQVAFILSIFSLTFVFGYKFSPKIKFDVMKMVWKFSTGNYASSIFGMLNANLQPILITNVLGPETTAFYFMPTMIISMFQSLPRSMASSVFAEGSHNEKNLRHLFFRSIKNSYGFMIPGVLFLMLIGPYILKIFGKDYSLQGTQYLQLTLLSLLIAVPANILSSFLYIKKKVRIILILTIIGACVGLTLTVLFLPYGLFGLGIANIVGQMIMLAIYIILFTQKWKKHHLLKNIHCYFHFY